MTSISIQTFSGEIGADGQPELLDRQEVALNEEQQQSLRDVALVHADTGMAALVESLITALLAKGVLSLDDLPMEAVDWLAKRSALRSEP